MSDFLQVSFTVRKRFMNNQDLATHLQRIIKDDMLLSAAGRPDIDGFTYVSAVKFEPVSEGLEEENNTK